MIGWLTNDPAAAKALRKADRDFEKAIAAAANIALAEKIEALKRAKQAQSSAYAKVRAL